MRKVIQIAIASHKGTGKAPDMIYALCDDGTVWYCASTYPEEWRRMKAIPQDPSEKKGEDGTSDHLPVPSGERVSRAVPTEKVEPPPFPKKVPLQAHEHLVDFEGGKTRRAVRAAKHKEGKK